MISLNKHGELEKVSKKDLKEKPLFVCMLCNKRFFKEENKTYFFLTKDGVFTTDMSEAVKNESEWALNIFLSLHLNVQRFLVKTVNIAPWLSAKKEMWEEIKIENINKEKLHR